ncbi:hypothetical protein TNCV_4273671 [Trichonephila clavipes]|nr:hypothetical protein TNCV_4273671 [Trichonephila clavipes]
MKVQKRSFFTSSFYFPIGWSPSTRIRSTFTLPRRRNLVLPWSLKPRGKSAAHFTYLNSEPMGDRRRPFAVVDQRSVHVTKHALSRSVELDKMRLQIAWIVWSALAGGAAAQEQPCYPPGGVAGIVVATVVVTCVVGGLGAALTHRYWWKPRHSSGKPFFLSLYAPALLRNWQFNRGWGAAPTTCCAEFCFDCHGAFDSYTFFAHLPIPYDSFNPTPRINFH